LKDQRRPIRAYGEVVAKPWVPVCRQLLQVVFAIRAIIAVAMVAKRQRASLFAAAHGVCALASGGRVP